MSRTFCAIAIRTLLATLLFAAIPVFGQTSVSGLIQENDMYPGLHPNLVFLLPPSPAEQSLFACLSGGNNDDCRDQVGAAAASGSEVQVATQRTGPKSLSFQTIGSVSPGNYFLFMFGRAQGTIPVSNQPYDNYFYGMQLLQVSPASSYFNVQFAPVEYHSR